MKKLRNNTMRRFSKDQNSAGLVRVRLALVLPLLLSLAPSVGRVRGAFLREALTDQVTDSGKPSMDPTPP